MEHGEQVPDYMLSGIQGDFTNFPMTHFYYGSDEVLYAEAPYFAKAFEKHGAPCAFHIGQGLCHCYPVASFCPEGKQAQGYLRVLLEEPFRIARERNIPCVLDTDTELKVKKYISCGMRKTAETTIKGGGTMYTMGRDFKDE